MFRSWRLQLREAEEAFRSGRLDEAQRVLSQSELQRFLPAKRLSAGVAGAIARRGRERIRAGEFDPGWQDLDTASTLAGDVADVRSVREEVVSHALKDAESDMGAGEPTRAIVKLESLQKRLPGSEAVRTLLEVARRLESARNLSRRGKFVDAESQLASAAALRPDVTVVQQRLEACRGNLQQSRELAEQLHKSLISESWSEALVFADRLLEMAPESPLGQDARRRAWRGVGAAAPELQRLAVTQPWTPSRSGGQNAATASARTTEVDFGSRFLLWVDGVGGYMICLGKEISIGQAVPGNRVAIPIQGNLSRMHARIRREDGYLIEPDHRVRVDGSEIRKTTLLNDGDEVEFGEGVRLRFRQPHALSATARLEFISRHRTQPSVDGILLMAESCVLGPKWQNHVVCREWTNDVVLYRRDGELFCRAMEPIEVDGRYCEGQARIEGNSQIMGSDFSLCLEEVA
jgi:hypothetical protein